MEYGRLADARHREAGPRHSNGPIELLVVQEKVRVNTYNDPYLHGGFYGRPGYGYYGNPWAYGGMTQTTVRQYTEANVYIDVVDASEHKLVWQGVATFTLTDKMQEQMRETVFTTVDKVFTKFPVPAPATSN